MSKKKSKFVVSSVTVALVATALAPVAGAASNLSDFKDSQSISSWAKNAASYLVEKGIMEGYNGEFAANRALTRGEIAKIMAMSLDLVKPGETVETNVQTGFSDVDGHWSAPYIKLLLDYNKDILNGYEDGTFKPNQEIRRDELAKIVVTAYKLNLNNQVKVSFKDSDNWAKEYIHILASHGIVIGSGDGNFDPSATVTRESAAVFVHRTLVKEVRVPADKNPSVVEVITPPIVTPPSSGGGSTVTPPSSGGGGGGSVTPPVDVEEVKAELNEISGKIVQYTESLKKLKEKAEELQGLINPPSSAQRNAISTLEDAVTNVQDLKDQLAKVLGKINALVKEIEVLKDQYQQKLDEVSTSISPETKKEFEKNISDFTETINSSTKLVEIIIEKVEDLKVAVLTTISFAVVGSVQLDSTIGIYEDSLIIVNEGFTKNTFEFTVTIDEEVTTYVATKVDGKWIITKNQEEIDKINQEAAAKVTIIISELPEMKDILTSGAIIIETQQAYNALTETQKGLVSEELKQKLSETVKNYISFTKADIAGLNVKVANENDLKKKQALVDAAQDKLVMAQELGLEADDYVFYKNQVVEAQKQIDSIEKAEKLAAAVAAANQAIEALPTVETVTVQDKALVEAAKAAVAAVKAIDASVVVTNEAIIAQLEDIIGELEGITGTTGVTEKISQLPEMKDILTSGAIIIETQQAYNALTETQKGLVSEELKQKLSETVKNYISFTKADIAGLNVKVANENDLKKKQALVDAAQDKLVMAQELGLEADEYVFYKNQVVEAQKQIDSIEKAEKLAAAVAAANQAIEALPTVETVTVQDKALVEAAKAAVAAVKAIDASVVVTNEAIIAQLEDIIGELEGITGTTGVTEKISQLPEMKDILTSGAIIIETQQAYNALTETQKGLVSEELKQKLSETVKNYISFTKADIAGLNVKVANENDLKKKQALVDAAQDKLVMAQELGLEADDYVFYKNQVVEAQKQIDSIEKAEKLAAAVAAANQAIEALPTVETVTVQDKALVEAAKAAVAAVKAIDASVVVTNEAIIAQLEDIIGELEGITGTTGVTEKISQLPEMKDILTSGAIIIETQQAYNALTETQKGLVSEELKQKLSETVKNYISFTKADIAGLNVKVANENDLEKKQALVDAAQDKLVMAQELGLEADEYVFYKNQVVEAQKQIDSIEKAEKLAAAVAAANQAIEALPTVETVTVQDKALVEAAKAAVAAVKAIDASVVVTNEAIIAQLEDIIGELEGITGTTGVTEKISQLPEMKDILTSGAIIIETQQAYNALTETQKGLVSEELKQKLSETVKNYISFTKADIAGLNVKVANENDLEKKQALVDAAQDKLVMAQELGLEADEYVFYKNQVVEAQKQIDSIEKAEKLAAAVAAANQAIEALPTVETVTVQDKALVEAAKAAVAAVKAIDASVVVTNEAIIAQLEDIIGELEGITGTTGVTEKISQLPEMKDILTSGAIIIETQQAYNALTETQKGLVSEELKQKLSETVKNYISFTKADIAGLNVKVANENDLEKKQALVDAAQDKLVMAQELGLEADEYVFYKNQVVEAQKQVDRTDQTNREVAAKVTIIISELPEMKDILTSGETILKTQEAYSALTEAQQAFVSGASKQKLSETVKNYISFTKADISGLNVKVANENDLVKKQALVEAAKANLGIAKELGFTGGEYEQTANQVAEAQKQVDRVNQEAADKAQEVMELIHAFPEAVTLDNEKAVEAARTAYEALSNQEKAYVTSLDLEKLATAEATILELNKEYGSAADKAQEVMELIHAFPEAVTLDNEKAVEAARTAYEALSDQEKAYVTSLDLEKLEVVENNIAKLKLSRAINTITYVVVSTDGSEVEPTEKWTTQEALTAIKAAVAVAEAVLEKEDATQVEVDAAVTTLQAAVGIYEAAQTMGRLPFTVTSVDGNVVTLTFTESVTATNITSFIGSVKGDVTSVDSSENKQVTITFETGTVTTTSIIDVTVQQDDSSTTYMLFNKDGKWSVAINNEELAKQKLTLLVSSAINTNVGTVTNYLDIKGLAVSGTTVTGNFAVSDTVKVGVASIYNGLAERAEAGGNLFGQVTIDENNKLTAVKEKDPVAYSVDSYVMNTAARYLRALGQTVNTPAKKIKFGDKEYTFDGSIWKQADNTTLVSQLVNAQNSAIREVIFQLVDENNYSVDVTFKAENVDITNNNYKFTDITVTPKKNKRNVTL